MPIHRTATPAKTLTERPMPGDTDSPQWADYSGGDTTIKKADFTDPNYARKAIFSMIGDEKKFPIILWAFDGEKKLTHFNLWGNTKIYRQMAKVMLIMNPDSKAIFMSGPAKKMILIALDGKVLEQPVAIDHQSPNGNPENDWDFIGGLPRRLQQIANQNASQESAPAPDYKAWINVNDRSIKAFPATKAHHDVLKAFPDTFGTATAGSPTKAQAIAEQNGWTACGVIHREGKTVAFVHGLEEKKAKMAAIMLYRSRYETDPWDSLTVLTNTSKKTYSKDQIADYLGSQ